MTEYAAFQRMWEAWKRNTKRPLDIEEAADWDTAHEIFRAVQSPHAEVADMEALAFVRDSLPRWHSPLVKLSGWNPQTNMVRLYRGMRNESAAEARVYGGATIPAGKIVCMTLERGSATGFAGQGNNDGYVCSADVPLSAIVFANLDGLYRDGNVHAEAEIVVLPGSDIPTRCESERVSPRVKPIASRAQKAANECEKIRLTEFESSLQKTREESRGETLELHERELA